MRGEPYRVLLIDDDEDTFHLTRGLLSRLTETTYELHWAADYDTGLNELRRGGYQVCLLDYRLGERDGLTLLREFVTAGGRVPIILLTGQDEHAIDVQAMKAGAVDYLVKEALDAARLERALRYAVERQRLLDTLRSQGEELERCRQKQVSELNQSLRDRLAELEALFEIVPVGIWIAHDPDCRRITGNRFGDSLMGVAQGTNVSLSAPAQERLDYQVYRQGRELQPDELPLQRAARSGQAVRDCELDVQFPNGTTLNLMSHAVPLFDAAGQVRGALTASWDVTLLKRAAEEKRAWEARLQHSQKLESLGILAGGIAHDFNNLLMGIIGYADLALLDVPAASPAVGFLEQAMTIARRAAELTGQMLAYSGKGRFIVQPVLLSEVVQELRPLLQVSISKSCALELHCEPGGPTIEADVVQLRQVLMNLIINASEALNGGGKIAVTTGAQHCTRAYLAGCDLADELPEGRYAFVEVADTGCGMTAETLARMFDPFFTTKTTGRGLGLAAVLGIVRSHRGALKVASQPNQGTRFRVCFPATERAALPLAVAPTCGSSPERGGTILVVDDEQWMRNLARTMLRKLGFEVRLAANGREAVEIYRTQADHIRLVLLDLTMPKMGGAEAFRELRRLQPEVRIILTSGYNQESASTHLDLTGLAGFLQKPYRYEELAAALVTALPS